MLRFQKKSSLGDWCPSVVYRPETVPPFACRSYATGTPNATVSVDCLCEGHVYPKRTQQGRWFKSLLDYCPRHVIVCLLYTCMCLYHEMC